MEEAGDFGQEIRESGRESDRREDGGSTELRCQGNKKRSCKGRKIEKTVSFSFIDDSDDTENEISIPNVPESENEGEIEFRVPGSERVPETECEEESTDLLPGLIQKRVDTSPVLTSPDTTPDDSPERPIPITPLAPARRKSRMTQSQLRAAQSTKKSKISSPCSESSDTTPDTSPSRLPVPITPLVLAPARRKTRMTESTANSTKKSASTPKNSNTKSTPKKLNTESTPKGTRKSKSPLPAVSPMTPSVTPRRSRRDRQPSRGNIRDFRFESLSLVVRVTVT